MGREWEAEANVQEHQDEMLILVTISCSHDTRNLRMNRNILFLPHYICTDTKAGMTRWHSGGQGDRDGAHVDPVEAPRSSSIFVVLLDTLAIGRVHEEEEEEVVVWLVQYSVAGDMLRVGEQGSACCVDA